MNSVSHEGKTVVEITEWMKYLGLYIPKRPDQILFETHFEESLKNPQSEASSIKLGTMEEARFIFRQSISHAIGMAYEVNLKKIKSKLDKSPLNWPTTLQFFRHARNACFHGNTFDIRLYKGTSTIDPTNPPAWRNYVIPDESVNNSIFAGAFFHLTWFYLF